jgi:hypothetical protein
VKWPLLIYGIMWSNQIGDVIQGCAVQI